MTRIQQQALAGSMMDEISGITGKCPFTSIGKTLLCDPSRELQAVLVARGVRFTSIGGRFPTCLINVTEANGRKLLARN